MKDEEIEIIVQKNFDLLFILGVGVTCILALSELSPGFMEKKIEWFLKSVDNVVYLNKEMPEFPADLQETTKC